MDLRDCFEYGCPESLVGFIILHIYSVVCSYDSIPWYFQLDCRFASKQSRSSSRNSTHADRANQASQWHFQYSAVPFQFNQATCWLKTPIIQVYHPRKSDRMELWPMSHHYPLIRYENLFKLQDILLWWQFILMTISFVQPLCCFIVYGEYTFCVFGGDEVLPYRSPFTP